MVERGDGVFIITGISVRKSLTLIMCLVVIVGCNETRENHQFRTLNQLADQLTLAIQTHDEEAYVDCFEVSASLSRVLTKEEVISYTYGELGEKITHYLMNEFRKAIPDDERKERNKMISITITKKDSDSIALVALKTPLHADKSGAEITTLQAILQNTGWSFLLDDEWCAKHHDLLKFHR